MQASISSPNPGLRPLQRALLDNPDISNNQNSEKHEHLGEAEPRQLSIDDGPWEKKNRFHVEDHKKNRDHVITNRVALPGIRIGIDPAFIGHQLADSTA